jgi:transposase
MEETQMPKKYIVCLTTSERTKLQELINTGEVVAYKRCHAQILLKADVNEQDGGWNDIQISSAFNISIRTVERTRQRLVEYGLDVALNRAKQTKTRKSRLDGEQEAHLIALSCGEPPDGYGRWTFQLLADKMIELEYVETISSETIRQVLKKRNKALEKQRVVHPP